ncbi:MAG: twin-arginine translocase TatA/TatE family subunit [Dehalococcoidia bacterium]|nr:MAG: twin-arginine translocase TatA/TatE family subunit [Dehalococcoidia bacterium]
MLGSLGWQELLIIVVILALLFGAQRVSGLGGALGKGIREFREEAKGDKDKAPALERPAGMSDAEWVEYQEFKKQQAKS